MNRPLPPYYQPTPPNDRVRAAEIPAPYRVTIDATKRPIAVLSRALEFGGSGIGDEGQLVFDRTVIQFEYQPDTRKLGMHLDSTTANWIYLYSPSQEIFLLIDGDRVPVVAQKPERESMEEGVSEKFTAPIERSVLERLSTATQVIVHLGPRIFTLIPEHQQAVCDFLTYFKDHPPQVASRAAPSADGPGLLVSDDPLGLFVTGVAPNSPAHRAGLRREDRITKIKGAPANKLELARALACGGTIAMTVTRAGAERSVTLELPKTK